MTALLAAALLAGCGEKREEPAPEGPEVVSIVQDDAELLHRPDAQVAATLDDLKGLGVDWVRITAGWSVIEPERGRFTWEPLDRAVRMARERGLGVNLDIAFFVPRWAKRDPMDPEAYGAFAEQVARRYPQTEAFTIWNEPNLGAFFLPQWEREGDAWVPASPHRYRELLYASVPRVKRVAPEALVLIGATSSLGQAEGEAEDDRMAPLTFARELACVDAEGRPLGDRPACRDFRPLPGDGWSHHPYSVELTPHEHDPEPETARLGDLGRLERVLAQLADDRRTERRLPLYLTEFGYQTNPPDPTQVFSPAQHVRLLGEAEEVARSHATVRGVAQFLLRDLPARPGDTARDRWRDYQSGLRFPDGAAKPGHAAWALPLTATRTSDGRVRFWGLVRPGAGEREVRVMAGRRELLRATTKADGTFARTVATDPSARFRLEAKLGTYWRSGPVLDGARTP